MDLPDAILAFNGAEYPRKQSLLRACATSRWSHTALPDAVNVVIAMLRAGGVYARRISPTKAPDMLPGEYELFVAKLVLAGFEIPLTLRWRENVI